MDLQLGQAAIHRQRVACGGATALCIGALCISLYASRMLMTAVLHMRHVYPEGAVACRTLATRGMQPVGAPLARAPVVKVVWGCTRKQIA